MKLKQDIVTQNIDDILFLIPVGKEAFNGIASNKKTAAFIVECLKEEITEEAIVDSMCARYDAPRTTIAADVKRILDTLRGINALEE